MDPPLCANGCGFFGTPATQNLCSKCYKDFLKDEETAKAKAKSMEKGMGPSVASTSSFDDVVTSIDQLSLSNYENMKKTLNDDSSTKKKVERCDKCNKKVGIIGFKCRCGSMFCAEHRLPEQHECNFDYKAMGREILKKQNPLFKLDKLEGKD